MGRETVRKGDSEAGRQRGSETEGTGKQNEATQGATSSRQRNATPLLSEKLGNTLLSGENVAEQYAFHPVLLVVALWILIHIILPDQGSLYTS